MNRLAEIVEVGHAWLYRASIYASNAFLDDPAILPLRFASKHLAVTSSCRN